jgi:hypothetical protein
MDAVKSNGEPVSSVIERIKVQESDSSWSFTERKTRIGIFSGTLKYRQGPAYNSGSYLSRAFISYLRKREQTDPSKWGDLIEEFVKIDPTPFYSEFGDHSIRSDSAEN